MKSIELERQASDTIGNGRRGFCDDGYDFTRLQISHVRIQLRTYLYICKQNKSRDSRKSLFAAQVVTNRCIMVLVDDTSAQVHVISNHSERVIELMDVVVHPKYIADVIAFGLR